MIGHLLRLDNEKRHRWRGRPQLMEYMNQITIDINEDSCEKVKGIKLQKLIMQNCSKPMKQFRKRFK